MFKIHPKVPECMSDEAKGFIMSCFEPNPDNRATAAELLMDTFLKSPGKKKLKVLQKLESDDSINSGEASIHLTAFHSISLSFCSVNTTFPLKC